MIYLLAVVYLICLFAAYLGLKIINQIDQYEESD